MGAREPGLDRTLAGLTLRRLLIRPYAAAGSRREPLIAGLCIIIIVAIFIVELVTPDDYVVIDIALLPMLAAIWVLSPRMAALVVIVAGLLFLIDLVIDGANRTTVVLLGVTMFVTALVARLHATTLASALYSRRYHRTNGPAPAMAPAFDAIDRSTRGVRSLTRRELEVARLAAEGLTAREIGDQLHIGTRTVETHLGSAYAKLRIRSRAELMRLAPRLDGSF